MKRINLCKIIYVIPQYFTSNNHKRYENGVWTGKNNYGAYRRFHFALLDIISGVELYAVSIHILGEGRSSFGDNIQMTPKIMAKYSITDKQVLMRGLEDAKVGDEFGNVRVEDFSDYGVELNYTDGELNNVTLKMVDRNVDINYFNE